MPRFLRRRPEAPEDSVAIRALTLATVLIAVTAVGVQEDFTPQAILAGGAIGAGFAVSFLLRRRRRMLLKTAITLLILLVARDFFSALLANPFDPRVPLVRLFLWLQLLHSFDLPSRKDLKYSMASAVVLIAVAAVYARDAAFGLLLLPFAAAASAAMAMMAAPKPVPLRPALSAGVVLAAGALLFGGVAFAAVPRGQGLRVRWLPVSPRLSLATRLHARIVNPAYPQDAVSDDPRQAPPEFNPEGYIGFSAHVDLRVRGKLTNDIVMRVRTTRPAFWRGLAFDEYTGVGWRMTDKSVEEYESDQPRIVPRFSADEPWPAGSEQVIQTFYIEAPQPNVFFAAYRPFEVYVPTISMGVDRYAGLRSPVPLEPGTIYSVISRVPSPGPRMLRRTRPYEPEAIRSRYLALPALPDRVLELAWALTEGAPSNYDKALAVNRHLSTLAYTLQAPLLPAGRDAVDHFLFETEQGSCEAFASAMTVLLRAAGVPARLVTGYTTGTYNIFTGYYEVRNSDAHAWVEVFTPGAGWIEFEPTPGFPAPDLVAASSTGQWLARDAVQWSVGAAARAWASAVGFASAMFARVPGPASLAGMLTVLLLSLLLIRRRVPAAGDMVSEAYARMLAALQARGLSRDPSATPREFLATVPDALRPPAEDVTEVFELVRYGGLRPSPEDGAKAREAAHRVREAARRFKAGRPA